MDGVGLSTPLTFLNNSSFFFQQLGGSPYADG